jgi:hypothetical protein
MTSLRNKVIRLAHTTKSANFRGELLKVLSRNPEISKDDWESVWEESQAARYKKGEFGYWWTVTKGKEDIGGKHYEKGIDCDNNNLTSLKGAPKSVGESFWCSANKLTSLEGAPQSVGVNFQCQGNKLTSLKGAPKSVKGNFWCHDNKLTSLKGAPQSVGVHFSCSDNKLTSLKGAPKSVGGYFHCEQNPGKFTKEDVQAVSKVKSGSSYDIT